MTEPDRRGTAGAIRFAADALGDEPRRALPRPQRRRPHRPRPDRADATPTASARRGRRSPSTRSRTPPPTAWSASTARARVTEFIEKTGEAVPGEINAGAYFLERSVLDLIPPGREVSIEREVFPRLVGDGPRRPAPRRLLDGHRHPRALPAGELGHPRGPGRDAGAADRARPAGRRRRRDRRRARPSGPRAVVSPGLPDRRRGARCATRSCSTAAASARAPASAARCSPPGVTVDAGRASLPARSSAAMRESRPVSP